MSEQRNTIPPKALPPHPISVASLVSAARAITSKKDAVVPTLVRSLVFLIFVYSLNARRLPIRTYTTADGLARDRVECALQDRTGFMWICTAEGLSRFDGYRFTNYTTEQGLPHNYVTDMLQTHEGTCSIWNFQ